MLLSENKNRPFKTYRYRVIEANKTTFIDVDRKALVQPESRELEYPVKEFHSRQP
jgi:hypothetical protein